MYSKLKKHVHSRVLTQLAIIGVASAGLLIAVGYDALAKEIGLGLAALGLLIGLGVGFLVGKIFTLAWHADTRKVIMSLDKMSFVLIALYVVFRIFGEQLLGHYVQGAALSAFSFAFLSGLLLGRLLTLWRGIRRILREQGIV